MLTLTFAFIIRITNWRGYPKEVAMAVDYLRLWKLLLDKGMKRTDLKSEAGISANVLARMGKNEYVSMESMEKICNTLGCRIEDVMEFKKGV